ncbi:MAG: ThiF family adenylyltransferase [Candidatus Eremiobacteraeota bacterium]|nr:ThiF family adenylyltransferase [Candidatus Eremiobacteraeota bacterium]MCL5055656.1 ThiF family adenylyltransferase [Bacillota bacterium]
MNNLFEKKILICGAGTLGGNLAENLGRTGFKKLIVIDQDIVEEKNLVNQPYFRFDVGQPKVKALSRNLFQASGTEAAGVHQTLTEGNGEKWIQSADLVIDAFDRHAARKAVKSLCEKLNIPCLHLGISPYQYGEVIWNEFYSVPPDLEEDPCEQTFSRSLALLAAAVSTEIIKRYFQQEEKESRTITLKDFAVLPLLK